MAFEVYDMDLCPGHAAMGDYHHHSYSDCLAQLVSDTGTGPSPVYGFAADGYPIYGPWEAARGAGAERLAGARLRRPGFAHRLRVAHVRNCLLHDPLDPSQGRCPRADRAAHRRDGDDAVGQRHLGHVGHLYAGLLV